MIVMASENISVDPMSIPSPETDSTETSPTLTTQHEEAGTSAYDYFNGLDVTEEALSNGGKFSLTMSRSTLTTLMRIQR